MKEKPEKCLYYWLFSTVTPCSTVSKPPVAYLRSLGSGSYDFTVVIGDMEIELTVEVTM